jgi:hypothetical protein
VNLHVPHPGTGHVPRPAKPAAPYRPEPPSGGHGEHGTANPHGSPKGPHIGVAPSSLDDHATGLGHLSQRLRDVAAGVGGIGVGSRSFGLVGQAFAGGAGDHLRQARHLTGRVADNVDHAATATRHTAHSYRDVEAENARAFREVDRGHRRAPALPTDVPSATTHSSRGGGKGRQRTTGDEQKGGGMRLGGKKAPSGGRPGKGGQPGGHGDGPGDPGGPGGGAGGGARRAGPKGLLVGSHQGKDVYLEHHQNKHQNPPLGSLNPYTGGAGQKFPPAVGEEWHRGYFSQRAGEIADAGMEVKYDQLRQLDADRVNGRIAAEDARAAHERAEIEARDAAEGARAAAGTPQEAQRAAEATQARQHADAAQHAYQRAHQQATAARDAYEQAAARRPNMDGYLDAAGRFTNTPQHTADGVRYQVNVDDTTSPPTVYYHNYPATTGGEAWWRDYGNALHRAHDLPGPGDGMRR